MFEDLKSWHAFYTTLYDLWPFQDPLDENTYKALTQLEITKK